MSPLWNGASPDLHLRDSVGISSFAFQALKCHISDTADVFDQNAGEEVGVNPAIYKICQCSGKGNRN